MALWVTSSGGVFRPSRKAFLSRNGLKRAASELRLTAGRRDKLRGETMMGSKLAGLALGLALAVGPVAAQEAKKELKPAPSASQALLEGWNDVGKKIIAIAEDLPEDKYDYKPDKDARTFRGVVLHVSASMYFFTDLAQKQKP